jgi:predicted DsbA family dithiol-disulfide isomerase
MPQLIVAHDYICPWCWIAWEQGKRLCAEFPTLELIWKGYELLPEGLPYVPKPPEPFADVKPKVPSRLDLLLAAENLVLPVRKRKYSISRLALEGAEFAMEAGRGDAYHAAMYHAYWEESLVISDRKVLQAVAEKAGLEVAAFDAALDDRRYKDRIVEFDDPAHAAGIYNVPTWMFPEEWIAEQPYHVLREYTERFLKSVVAE